MANAHSNLPFAVLIENGLFITLSKIYLFSGGAAMIISSAAVAISVVLSFLVSSTGVLLLWNLVIRTQFLNHTDSIYFCNKQPSTLLFHHIYFSAVTVINMVGVYLNLSLQHFLVSRLLFVSMGMRLHLHVGNDQILDDGKTCCLPPFLDDYNAITSLN